MTITASVSVPRQYRLDKCETVDLAAAAAASCPTWCAAHIDTDRGVMHISAEQVVEHTAGGPVENGSSYVSLERADAGATVVRVEGTDLMSPAEALQLAAALEVAARAAIGAGR